MAEDTARGADDTQSFGQELRREREVRNVTLEEISRATRISVRFLTALENDDFATLPAPVFTKGFIRAFARYLGLDPESSVNSYLYHRQGVSRGRGAAPSEERVEEKRALAGMHETLATRRRIGSLVGILVLAAVAAWWMLRLRAEKPRPPAPVPVPRAKLQPPAPPPTPIPAQIVLILEFSAKSWLDLSVDGVEQAGVLMLAGDRREISAEKEIDVLFGNAGGARGWLGGTELPAFGRAGDVVRYRVTRDGAVQIPTADRGDGGT